MNLDMSKRLDKWLRQEKHPEYPSDKNLTVCDGFEDDRKIMSEDSRGAWISCHENDMIEVGTGEKV
jgi:hypothetical protein